MHLISALASGMVGGGSGYARIFLRGTSTRATYYTDFEGLAPVTSGADITLDGNGRTIAYVNTLVDVSVYSSAGVLLGTFTAGVASTAVEVRNASFTGVNYQTGASAAGNPTDLDAVLTKWNASASAVDFNVEMQGTDMALKNAFWKTRKVFNVKDPAYGAVGNGFTDDYAAINSALTALVAAGGGVLYFPQGNYAVTSALSLTTSTPMYIIGDGPDVSRLSQAGAATNLIAISNATSSQLTIADMSFNTDLNAFPALTMAIVTCVVKNCTFRSIVAASAVSVTSASTTLALQDCRFVLGGTGSRAVLSTIAGGSGLVCRANNCVFDASATGPYAVGANNGMVDGCGIGLTSCLFIVPATAVSGACVQADSASGLGMNGYVISCVFKMNNGIMYCIGSSDTTGFFHESGNSFQDIDATRSPISFFLSGSETGIVLASKRDLVKATNNTLANVTLDASSYGQYALRQTAGAAVTIGLDSSGPIGDEIVITVYNNTGGALAVTLDAASFYTTWAATSIATTRKRSLRFVRCNFNGTYRYMQVGADAGDLG